MRRSAINNHHGVPVTGVQKRHHPDITISSGAHGSVIPQAANVRSRAAKSPVTITALWLRAQPVDATPFILIEKVLKPMAFLRGTSRGSVSARGPRARRIVPGQMNIIELQVDDVLNAISELVSGGRESGRLPRRSSARRYSSPRWTLGTCRRTLRRGVFQR